MQGLNTSIRCSPHWTVGHEDK